MSIGLYRGIGIGIECSGGWFVGKWLFSVNEVLSNNGGYFGQERAWELSIDDNHLQILAQFLASIVLRVHFGVELHGVQVPKAFNGKINGLHAFVQDEALELGRQLPAAHHQQRAQLRKEEVNVVIAQIVQLVDQVLDQILNIEWASVWFWCTFDDDK